jgi:hypothetical protein
MGGENVRYVRRALDQIIHLRMLVDFSFSKKVKRVEVTGIFNIIRWAENLRDTSVEGELGGDGDGGR